MESIRRFFHHGGGDDSSDGDGGGDNAATSSSRGSDDPTDEPMQLDSQVSHLNHAEADDMPPLVDPSESSDEEEEGSDNDLMDASTTVVHPQINPVDRVPDRRPRVDDGGDDERARRTPSTAPGTPTPSFLSQARPIRPLPRAFGRLPMPLAGSYVMQGVSYVVPRRGSVQAQTPVLAHMPVPASAEGLVEPLAAAAHPHPHPHPHPHLHHANLPAPTGPDGEQNDGTPAWLAGVLASIINTVAHTYARQDEASQGQGLHNASMNVIIPDVGVAASATARQAPRDHVAGTHVPPTVVVPDPASDSAPAPVPSQTQNNPAPVPGAMPMPTAQHADAAFAEILRMHAEARQAFEQELQRMNQHQHQHQQPLQQPLQQRVPAPAPPPNTIPVHAMPFPFPVFLGGPMHDEPVEDPAQARHLIEGLEEVPVGLVKRYMRVEQSADDGTGACAICWEPLDAQLEENDATDDADLQSGTPSETTSGSEDVPAQPSEAPLRPRIVVLPCGHPFHSTCLEPWFSQRTTCPNCRYNVDPDGLTSSIQSRRRMLGPLPHMHGPPPGFFADMMAQFAAQAQAIQNQEPQPQEDEEPNDAVLPQPARFTLNISPTAPFPVGPPPPPQDALPNSVPGQAQFPFSFWPPIPQQPGQAPLVNGPRIHRHHRQHQVVNGVPTSLETIEIELDIGVSVPIGGGRPVPPGPASDVFFHFVAPLPSDTPAPQPDQQQQPEPAQHPEQSSGAEPQHPPPAPGPVPRLPHFRDLFPEMRPSQPRRKWSRPDPQGRTLRQHVEQRERELGLRCDFMSCDLAPTDEDPTPHAADVARTIHLHVTGEKHCAHTFHPQCIVTAARVAAAGVGDEPGPAAVSCPLCRVEGSVELQDWTDGERSLQAELEA